MAVDKLVDSTQLDADLTAVANAIRTKGGTSAQMAFPAGFVSAVEAIETGGGADLDLQTALISGIFDKDYEISGTTIGRAFANCVGEYNINFPDVTTLRVNAYTFENSQFASINLPKLQGTIGSAFRSFKGKHIYAPKIQTAADNAFDSCSNLLDAFFPELDVSTNAFTGCSKMKTAVCGYTGNSYYQFRNCAALSAVDFCKGGTKIDNTFDGCASLATLALRSDAVLPLTNLSAFNNTPFASGGTGGTIYIPKVLYDHLGDGSSSDYKAATNWSTVNGYGTITWAQIEGSIYETQYADGTPIT